MLRKVSSDRGSKRRFRNNCFLVVAFGRSDFNFTSWSHASYLRDVFGMVQCWCQTPHPNSKYSGVCLAQEVEPVIALTPWQMK